jgi:arabinogalactan oligomer/maltooligosaccharide transport system substrate-binding protein
MKKVRLRALVAAAVMAAFAAVASIAAAGVGATTTTLSFWQTMNAQETVTLRGIVDRFEATHPGIEVDMETVPFDQAQLKFATAAQAGQAPDVLRAEIAWIADYAARGFLAPIDAKVSAADKRDFLPAPFNYGVYAGKTWAIPQVTDAPALLYNKAMFKQYKVQVPKSMDALVNACMKFPAGKGIFLRGDAYFVQPWIWAYGGGLLDPKTKTILVSNQGSIDGLQKYKDLFINRCAFRNRDFANDYNNMMTAFKNGDVAMIVNGPWASADILTGKAFRSSSNFGIAPLPAGPKGQGSPVGGHSYVISRNSKNFDAAYTFVQWLSSAQNQGILAEKNNLLPTRQSAYALPNVKKNRLLGDFLKQMKVATNRPVIPEGGQIYADFTPNVQKLLQGQITAKAAAQAVASAWGKFLRGWKAAAA